MATLLDTLTRRCIQFESASPPCRNTVITTHISPEEWVEWEDFTYAQITSAFGRQLSKPYPGAKEPKPLPRDLAIYDETAPDLALWHFRFPVINLALSEMDQAPYYTRGALAPLRGSKFNPDWCSEVRPSRLIHVLTTSSTIDKAIVYLSWPETWSKLIRFAGLGTNMPAQGICLIGSRNPPQPFLQPATSSMYCAPNKTAWSWHHHAILTSFDDSPRGLWVVQ
jgi:hypothetical protein